MKKTLLLLVTLLAINPAASLLAQQPQVDQPRMRTALARLQEARTALDRAERNKNGHRERAIELVNQAIAEVQAGMAQAR
jgi:hypothetical protein